MKRTLFLCLFIIMTIMNGQKAKCEGYEPETPEEAAFFTIANKNISPNDITESNIVKYKEEEMCWIGKITGYSRNAYKETIFLLLDYYAYNWQKTGNQNKFVLQQIEEKIEFGVGFYIPENRENFIEGFHDGTIEFVIIYGKATEFRGYKDDADESHHLFVSIEEVDYMRILDNDLVEIAPFEAGVNDILQENDVAAQEEAETESELSENNKPENLPQADESTGGKYKFLIIAVISFLAIAVVGFAIARRYRKAAKKTKKTRRVE